VSSNLYFCPILIKIKNSSIFFKNPKMSNFMIIRPVGAPLTDMAKLTVAVAILRTHL
jgi:hypothetical protein